MNSVSNVEKLKQELEQILRDRNKAERALEPAQALLEEASKKLQDTVEYKYFDYAKAAVVDANTALVTLDACVRELSLLIYQESAETTVREGISVSRYYAPVYEEDRLFDWLLIHRQSYLMVNSGKVRKYFNDLLEDGAPIRKVEEPRVVIRAKAKEV